MSLEARYRIKHEWACRGYDRKTCWVQCRAGAIPRGYAGENRNPAVVMTMQKLLLSGCDVFYELNEMRTDDLAATWSGPTPHSATLGRRLDSDGSVAVICDATPRWHSTGKKLLLTGHVARYLGDALVPGLRSRATAYSVYEPLSRSWTEWKSLEMPDMKGQFFSSGAGCSQRFDLANGDILLPIYYTPKPASGEPSPCHWATVCRCSLDGNVLRYIEHGSELTCPEPCGFGEPSLTRFGGKFFLTLRNNERGWVCSGDDGLHFDSPKPWRFDDGAELGNYNTQQHWVTHSDALFLVYTRSGLNNDHVFRHRAPLVMAQVDPDRMCVLRETERVVVPERGARLGNFAVAEVSSHETWIIAAEWMQNAGTTARVMMDKLGLRKPDDKWPPRNGQNYAVECEGFGSENTVWIARILWEKPNAFPSWLSPIQCQP